MVIRLEPNAELIPGYRLIERLGNGGFGEVWKAEAPGGILKAIKVVFGQMPAHTRGKEENKADRELKGLARVKEIRHPFILSMDRYEEVEGRLIIVMELADRDLECRMRECREQAMPGIPRDELLKYLAEAAEALDMMNFEFDVQHLDIKPQNLFLVQHHVKVADFGLAKDLEGFSAQATSGMTPMYAAPEIFAGNISRNTDQYSLAIVFQELLTGKLPFCGPSPMQFMTQHLKKEPDLRTLPGHDQPIIKRALEKDPNRRFRTCHELIDRLLAAKDSPTIAGFRAGDPKGDSKDSEPLTEPQATRGPIIGIDLGTTNSVVAVMDGKESRVITDQEGNRLTPSVVALTGKGERLVGGPAKRQATTNASRTVHSIKRFMGRRRCEVAEEEARVSYKVIGEPNDLVKLDLEGKAFSPPEVSAMVLGKLRRSAEEYLGQAVTRAVITVPAYFNDSQRQATKDAGRIAGLEVERIINEPTAASLAYGLERKKQNERIAVFDLGGGTFDVTILRIRDGIFDVLSTNGDTRLGGDDFDQRVLAHLAAEFEEEHGFDPRSDATALQRLVEAAEKAKKELSTQTQTDVNLPFLSADATGPKHLVRTVLRSDFEQMCDDLFERLRAPCLAALDDAKLKPTDLDEVVLVGGSTRMPRVRELATEFFGREPQKGVDPDEAIAVGAAIQAAMLDGALEDVLLLDVTPLSLGVETKAGLVNKIIERNTTIPTFKKKVFTTAESGQTEVGIHVVQGDREFAVDNRSLGIFWLEGIRPAPAGVPEIEVTFNIDANGILSVAAKDLKGGVERSLTVESSGTLSAQEIERMRVDAETHADQDETRRQLLEAKNAAAAVCFNADKMLKDGGHISDSNRQAVKKAVDGIQSATQAEDLTRLPMIIWTLQQLLRAIQVERVHKQAMSGGGPREAARAHAH